MMNIKTTLAALASAAVFTLAACGGSGGGEAKGPNSEERTTAFKAMMPNFSNMGKMVKGEEPYDVEKFKTAALAFADESKKPFEHFERDAAVDGKPQDGDALPAVHLDAGDALHRRRRARGGRGLRPRAGRSSRGLRSLPPGRMAAQLPHGLRAGARLARLARGAGRRASGRSAAAF